MLSDRSVDTKAGVADHHVEPAETLDRCCDEALHVRLTRDVRGDGDRLAAQCDDLVDEGLQSIDAARAGHDGRAPLCQSDRGGTSDAGRCAGDRDDTI